MKETNYQPFPDYVFETSWEVCNKVGGIYAVLSTKAATIRKQLKDNVIFFGPDIWDETHPCPVFSEQPRLLASWRRNCKLPCGITVRAGRWEIPGRPIAVLVKFDSLYACKNDIYARMWERFGVDSLHAYGDYDEACAFSVAAAMAIESLTRFLTAKCEKAGEPEPVFLAHFDEWTTGMGLLYLKDKMPRTATVFTTHATSIGRSICGNGKELYRYLDLYDGDVMARELNMESKHSLEKAAARNADTFTTVSKVTARECESLLGLRPEVTPNGFEAGFVPVGAAYDRQRQLARKKIIDIAGALTGRVYGPDTFVVATSGRCEYRNKGIDLYLDVMAHLRHTIPAGHEVISLVLVPAWSAGAREDLRNAASIKPGHPLPDPVITHHLNNYDSDPINQRIHDLGFAACPWPISVIYVPCYLDGSDGIFNLGYYDLLPGLDATVFPSYYEPWGYTPLESIAFGVPTVTTSLSGFGQWILDHFDNSFEACGVRVEKRDDNNYHQICDAIANDLQWLISNSDEATRRKIARAAGATAAKASWTIFFDHYIQAYRKAIKNKQNSNCNLNDK